MIAATLPIQRPSDARLLFVNRGGEIQHWPRAAFASLLKAGDLVVANDAATLPASLFGIHMPSGRAIEVRLAGRRSLDPVEVRDFAALVFGDGDFRTRTEDRVLPPTLRPGDRLELGPLRASVQKLEGHPRLVLLQFDGSPREIWEGLARHGKPVQYAHVHDQLALWNTWSPIAGVPVAFEPPSAGFTLSWEMLASLTCRGIQFATLTHTAGLSSTGDAALDARLPFDEPYRIPRSTAERVRRTRARNGRIVAVGTTVVRALEHARSAQGDVLAGEGMAIQKITRSSELHIVDALLSGTHETGTSHHELLRAFVQEGTLRRMDEQLNARRYRTHEFGDSILVEASLHNRNSRPST